MIYTLVLHSIFLFSMYFLNKPIESYFLVTGDGEM